MSAKQRGNRVWRAGRGAVAVVLASGMLLIAGCAEDNPLGREPLEGVVTLDGVALDSGMIMFEPPASGGVATGAAIENGEFRIARSEGLPPGEYTVRITAAEVDAAAVAALPPGTPEPPGRERIPPRYNARSELRATVEQGKPNIFPFALESR